jgi:hypothetical protein
METFLAQMVVGRAPMKKGPRHRRGLKLGYAFEHHKTRCNCRAEFEPAATKELGQNEWLHAR